MKACGVGVWVSILYTYVCFLCWTLQACSYDYERLEFILEQLDAMAGLVEVDIMAKVMSHRGRWILRSSPLALEDK